MGRYVIKYGELVYDAVYLNSLANFKQWYTATEKNEVIFFCPAAITISKLRLSTSHSDDRYGFKEDSKQ